MSEQETQRAEGQGEDQQVKSAAPEDEQRVVGENADVPAGEGEEADEAGVEGGSEPEGSESREHRDAGAAGGAEDSDSDDRNELAREIESDPANNPDDPVLREIKGG